MQLAIEFPVVSVQDLFHYGGVSQGGDISQLVWLVRSYLPQDPAHDLPRASLG